MILQGLGDCLRGGFGEAFGLVLCGALIMTYLQELLRLQGANGFDQHSASALGTVRRWSHKLFLALRQVA